MHIGQIKHFYKGNKNGILSYKDENGQLCEIQFFHQEYRLFVDDPYAKKRGWKYGDTVEFEIEFYNDQPKAVFKRFVGNTLLERLKQSVSEDNHIEGYFYLHRNTHHCTLRERNTGIEFRITNVKHRFGWVLPENGTCVKGIVTDLNKLTCKTEDSMRDEVFEQAIAPLETRRFIRATVTELVPEYDIMRIEIDGFNYPCFVSTKNLMETYQVGDPINVRLTSKEALKFVVI